MYTILTADALGRVLYFSDAVNSTFYKSSQITSVNTVISSTGFSTLYQLSSPAQELGWTYANRKITVTSIGGINLNNSTYYAPTVYQTNTDIITDPDRYVPAVTSAQTAVFSFGNTTGTIDPYGFFASSPNGNNTIDQNYKIFYVHKTSTGSILRTGTAVSLESVYSSFASTPATIDEGTSKSWNVAANIVFDQEYDTPPLIFIKECTNWIALHQFKRNAAGKFIGAVIVSNSDFRFDPRSNIYGFAATGPTTANFTYYIVSQEMPIYGNSSDQYGMKVFNSNGEVAFDSSQFVTSFFSLNINRPYLTWVPVPNTSTQRQLEQRNAVALSATGGLGICINNLQAITGLLRYRAYQVFLNGTPIASNGPASFYGVFLYISPISATESEIGIYPLGTSGISTMDDSNGAAATRVWRAHDFALENSPVISIVGSYYDYYGQLSFV
jgi:hypothetical protein